MNRNIPPPSCIPPDAHNEWRGLFRQMRKRENGMTQIEAYWNTTDWFVDARVELGRYEEFTLGNYFEIIGRQFENGWLNESRYNRIRAIR